MKNKEKILITGSCGFTFGNFIRKMVYEKHPYEVVGVDRLSHLDLNAIYWNKNHSFYLADVNDPHIMRNIFQYEKPSLVIHGAHESDNEDKMITTNVQGTQNIVSLCKEFNVEKFVYMSTDQVYGPRKMDYSTELDLLNPKTVFANSKVMAESIVRVALDNSKTKFNIVRLSNCYGPRQNKGEFIPNAIKDRHVLNQTTSFKLNDSRDWLHVFDACSGILTILNKGKNKETYNVSADQELSTLEVLNRIDDYMKLPGGSQSISGGERYFSSNQKLKELGWNTEFKFKDGLYNTIDWFLHNTWVLK